MDEFGEEEVYDYYTVGGGWSDLFHGKDALCYCDDSELFRWSVGEVIGQRNNAFLSLRDEITGVSKHVGLGERAHLHILGPVGVRRMWRELAHETPECCDG